MHLHILNIMSKNSFHAHPPHVNQPVRWLGSGLISPVGADLLWEKNTIPWLISPGWNQQTNRLNKSNPNLIWQPCPDALHVRYVGSVWFLAITHQTTSKATTLLFGYWLKLGIYSFCSSFFCHVCGARFRHHTCAWRSLARNQTPS